MFGLLSITSAAQDAIATAQNLLAVPSLARVTDSAAVLSAPQVRALEEKLAAFEAAHGSQIAIVLVPSVKPEPIEDYAHRIADTWKLGRAEVGDGVLIVVATQDHRARIEVMRALEGAVPDVVAYRIIREQMAPHFKRNDYAAGLNAALDALFQHIESEGLAPVQRVAPGAIDEGGWAALVLPWVIVGMIVGQALRRVMGVPGALLAGGVVGVGAYVVLASILLGVVTGGLVFAATALLGSGIHRAVGGRRGGFDPFIPAGWSAGNGNRGGWSDGGWSSGGGGDAAGGGASGDW